MSKSSIPRSDGSGLNELIVPSTRRAASEVAACIARHARGRGEADGLDPQRVHNLLFLCQGYSLAAHGRPLFTGRLVASPGGVSCPDASDPDEDQHAGDGSEELREVVARVWEKFGGMTPPKLQTCIQGHVWCVQEMAGGGPDLSADPEALEKAFRLAVQEGLI